MTRMYWLAAWYSSATFSVDVPPTSLIARLCSCISLLLRVAFVQCAAPAWRVRRRFSVISRDVSSLSEWSQSLTIFQKRTATTSDGSSSGFSGSAYSSSYATLNIGTSVISPLARE